LVGLAVVRVAPLARGALQGTNITGRPESSECRT
jgi:hypothetical protein